jgi:hypothetical protein
VSGYDARTLRVTGCINSHGTEIGGVLQMDKKRNWIITFAFVSAAALAVGSLGAAPQFFGSDLTLHETTTSAGAPGGNRTTAVTTYLSGNAIKRSSSDGKDTILRLDQSKMISVDNSKKTYVEITFEQMQQLMDKLGGGAQGRAEQQQALEAMRKMMGATMAEISVTKVGPGEPVAGYPTEKYLVKGPMEMEIWAAPSLKMPPQYYDALKTTLARNPMFDMGKLYDEMKKINGVSMKTVTTMKMMNMEIKTTTVVNSVDKGAIPKSTFDIPAGYQKTDSPLR